MGRASHAPFERGVKRVPDPPVSQLTSSPGRFRAKTRQVTILCRTDSYVCMYTSRADRLVLLLELSRAHGEKDFPSARRLMSQDAFRLPYA